MMNKLFARKKQNKYRNIKITCPETGKKFDSKKEYKRWLELKLLERAGEIKQFQTQEKFVILESFKDSEGKTERSVNYLADFVYFDVKLNKMIVEDVKSEITKRDSTYIIKRKFIKKKYPQYIFRET